MRKYKPRFKDMSGQRFGRLMALRFVGTNSRNRAIWECRCDCGTVKSILALYLRTGRVVSCGCFRIEQVRKAATKHGKCGTKEYGRISTHRRRELAAKLDSLWTVEMEVLLRQKFTTCVLCGSTDRLETDHLLPISKGYGLRPGNAVVLCRFCNRSKSNKILSDLPIVDMNRLFRAATDFYFLCIKEGLWLREGLSLAGV